MRDTEGSRTRGRKLWLTVAMAALAAVAALVLAACGSSDSSTSAEATSGGGGEEETTVSADTGGGGEVSDITWAIPGDIVSLDPTFNYDYTTTTVDNQICESLLKVNAEGELEPNVAEKWSEPNATTYVFDLRKGVKFHSGDTVTPEDVKFSIERDKDPKLGSYLVGFPERVKTVDVTGPNQVTVHMSEPDATWKYAAANQSTAIISKKFVEANGDSKGAVGQPKVGIDCTGPFKVDSWTPGQDIKVSAFDEYWDGAPKVKKIDFKIVEDEQTLVSGLNNGEIDGVIQQISGQSAKQLDPNTVNLLNGPSVNASFVAFNTQRAPFDDVRVRQALSYALDKKGIEESVYAGYAEDSKSPAPPLLWTYSKPTWEAAYEKLPSYELDVEKAKELIKEAGAEGAEADLLYTGETDAQTAIAVQNAASEIGLTIKPKKLPPAQLTALQYAEGEKEYDSTLLTWGSDFPDPIGNLNYPFNSATPVTNVVEYDNPKVDKLLDTARGTVDDDKRATLLQEAQAIIVEEQPWLVYAAPEILMPLNNRLSTSYQPNGFWYFQHWAAELSGS